MDTGVKYINLICELYNIDDKEKGKMIKYIDNIIRSLSMFSWTEIEYAVKEYFKLNSKTQPKLTDVRGLILQRKEELENMPPMPTTKIRILQDSFLTVCRAAHVSGVAGFYGIEYFRVAENLIPANNVVLDKDKDIIKPKRWFWEDAINTAKERFPDSFAPFRDLNFYEEATMAYKLGILRL